MNKYKNEPGKSVLQMMGVDPELMHQRLSEIIKNLFKKDETISLTLVTEKMFDAFTEEDQKYLDFLAITKIFDFYFSQNQPPIPQETKGLIDLSRVTK